MANQAENSLLEDLIKSTKKQVRNGFVAGLIGLALTCLGFFSYAFNLRLGGAWLAIGIGGIAIVIAAFYTMIHADKQAEALKRQAGSANLPIVPSPEAPGDSAEGDVYFSEDPEKWKNPFEEDKE